MNTDYQDDKLVQPASVQLQGLDEPWSALNGLTVDGYEIRHGRMTARSSHTTNLVVQGNVLASTVHGLFEDQDFVGRLIGTRPRLLQEETFDLLADAIEENLDTDILKAMVNR